MFQEDEEDGDGGSDVEEKKDPTHYSEMDPKTMKVAVFLFVYNQLFGPTLLFTSHKTRFLISVCSACAVKSLYLAYEILCCYHALLTHRAWLHLS